MKPYPSGESSSDLGYNPWAAKAKLEELRPGPRLDAIVARHYLGFTVLERTFPSGTLYAARIPQWWLDKADDAVAMTHGVPTYSWPQSEDLADTMTLLDLAVDYEISTMGGGREIECRAWFKTVGHRDPNERICGQGKAKEYDFPAVDREDRLPTSQVLGLAVCRAVLDAVNEMSDKDYEAHLTNVRRTILRLSRRFHERYLEKSGGVR